MEDQRSYPLPTETIPGLDLTHHLEDLVELRSFFETRGIETRNTRIDRYRQYLEQACSPGDAALDAAKIFKNSVGPPFLSDWDWYLYVLREVHELMWILKGLKAHLPVGVDDKLRLIVGGRDFAALDVDSQSRNAQFELRIASYFCQNGCDVNLSTDTDIVALTNEYAFYLECKRIGSNSQLGKRLSEARTQLAQRLPRKDGSRLVLGCIAVDVTKLAFAHNGLTWAFSNDQSRDVVQRRLLAVANEASSRLSFESCRKLLSYWFQIHIASLIMRPVVTPATRFSSYHIARPRLGRKEATTVKKFYAMFESVSKEDARAVPTQTLTRRTTVNFPAGSTFNLKRERVLALLTKDELSEADQLEVVGTLTIGEKKDEFTFVEILMLGTDDVDEWRNASADAEIRADLILLARLYMQRYPYFEAEANVADVQSESP